MERNLLNFLSKSKIILLISILFLILPFVESLCSEGQIDINNASLSELDLLYGIGEFKAQAIIDTRPFNSVDDLINVSGIGEVTLQNIIDQGLACVSSEIEIHPQTQNPPSENQTDNSSSQENIIIKEETNFREPLVVKHIPEEISLTPPEVIKLVPRVGKTIKSEKYTENLDKNNSGYALPVFGGFSVLILILSLLKIVRLKKYKNEFRN